MTDQELDECYGALCRAMSERSEEEASLLLCRFALLCMTDLDDPARIATLIDDARLDADVP